MERSGEPHKKGRLAGGPPREPPVIRAGYRNAPAPAEPPQSGEKTGLDRGTGVLTSCCRTRYSDLKA